MPEQNNANSHSRQTVEWLQNAHKKLNNAQPSTESEVTITSATSAVCEIKAGLTCIKPQFKHEFKAKCKKSNCTGDMVTDAPNETRQLFVCSRDPMHPTFTWFKISEEEYGGFTSKVCSDQPTQKLTV